MGDKNPAKVTGFTASVIVKSANGDLVLQSIAVPSVKIDFTNYYNSNKSVEKLFSDTITFCSKQQKSKKKVILVGGNGQSGKTTFIRGLCSEIVEKDTTAQFVILTTDNLENFDTIDMIALLNKTYLKSNSIYFIADSIDSQRAMDKLNSFLKSMFYDAYSNFKYIVTKNIFTKQLNSTQVIADFYFDQLSAGVAADIVVKNVPKYDKNKLRKNCTLGEIYEIIEKEVNK